MNKIFLSGAALIATLAPIAAQAAEALPQAVRASVAAGADYARGDGRGQGRGNEGRGGGSWNRGDNGVRQGGGRNEGGQRQGGNWNGNRGGQASAPAPTTAPVIRENRSQASGQYRHGGNDNRWNRSDDNRRQQNRGQANVDYNRGRGSVSGQYERRDDNRNRGDWNRNDDRRWDRGDNRGRSSVSGQWNRSWRNDNRYDWRRYRESNRNYFRPGRYYAPYNNYRYSRISIGFYIGAGFYGSNYWISDPWSYRLPAAYGNYRWVRYYDDVLLIDIRNGYVVDVIENFFW